MGPPAGARLCILGFLLFHACCGFQSEDFLQWYSSVSSSSSSSTPEVSCDWTLPDAGIFKKNYVIVCPANCLDHAHCVNVKGSGPYTVHSPICLSAIHAGVIGNKGGGVSVSVSKPTAPFVGSLKNSVVSIAADSDFGAITLEKADVSCNPPTPTPGPCVCCSSALVDLVFVVDSSVSVGKNDFKLAKDFVKDLTNLFSISKTATRIGLVTFNTYPTTPFKLNRYTNKEDVMKALDAVTYKQGGTYIGKALYRVVKDMIFRSDPDVEKIVVVMSDGRSFDPVTKPVALLADKKVTMVSLGIGRSRQLGANTLLQIANGVQENYYSIESYAVLKNYLSSITQRLAYIIKCPYVN